MRAWTPQALRAFLLGRAKQCGAETTQKLITSLRAFLRYLSFRGEARPDLDLAIPAIAHWRLASLPRCLSAKELELLIAACDGDTPTRLRDRAIVLLLSRLGLRPHTYATLISLLAATGLRVSEALDLLLSDIQAEGLLIRKTKFQKTRLVPLHETAIAGLRQYLKRRRRLHPGGDHVFVSNRGQRLAYWEVRAVFRKLLKSADLIPKRGPVPRLHELRHTLAVRALEASPGGRQRIGQHMLALATYLGHVNINATYWYLESTAELLRDIASAGENFLSGGRL